MEDYEEIKLEKYREVICFSFLLLVFLSGELIITKEVFGFVKINQQKVKYRYREFEEFNYSFFWTPFKYKWIKI